MIEAHYPAEKDVTAQMQIRRWISGATRSCRNEYPFRDARLKVDQWDYKN